MQKFLSNIYIQLGLLLVLFFIETISSEMVTAVAFLIASITFLCVFKNKKEVLLFCIGLIGGTLIEVVLGFINRHQFWSQTGLFGVPLWLPIAWGLGFVLIRRIGNNVVDFKK